MTLKQRLVHMKGYLTSGILLTLASRVFSLQCWKCVGHDCYKDPSTTSTSTKSICKERESCVKVYYTIPDMTSSSTNTSITRSCSSGPCVPTSEKNYDDCLQKERYYKIYGCAKRICCNNQDLCNASFSLHKLVIYIEIGTFLLIMSVM